MIKLFKVLKEHTPFLIIPLGLLMIGIQIFTWDIVPKEGEELFYIGMKLLSGAFCILSAFLLYFYPAEQARINLKNIATEGEKAKGQWDR